MHPDGVRLRRAGFLRTLHPAEVLAAAWTLVAGFCSCRREILTRTAMPAVRAVRQLGQCAGPLKQPIPQCYNAVRKGRPSMSFITTLTPVSIRRNLFGD